MRQIVRHVLGRDKPTVGSPLPRALGRFDPFLLQRNGPDFSALPSLSGNKAYQAAIGTLVQQLCSPKVQEKTVQGAFQALSKTVRTVLTEKKATGGQAQARLPVVPDAIRIDFELSDGRQALEHFKQVLEGEAKGDDARRLMQRRFDERFDAAFLFHFDAAVQSLDIKTERSPDTQARIQAIHLKGERYVLDREIGEGDAGRVVVYRHQDGRRVVLKIPFGNHRNGTVEGLAREARFMLNAMGTGAGADCIVSLLGVIREQPEGLMLVLPYAEHGSLQEVLPVLETAELQPSLRSAMKLTLMHDVVLAAYRLQIKGILHSDLTARNFLLFGDGKCRASDFGLAELFNDQDWIASAVLPNDPGLVHDDVAPEYWSGELTPDSDTYQVGRLLFEIVYGKSLSSMGIGAIDSQSSFDPEHQLAPIPAHEWPGVDTIALRSMLVSMLQFDPAKRMSLSDAAASRLFRGAAIGSEKTRTAIVEILRLSPQL